MPGPTSSGAEPTEPSMLGRHADILKQVLPRGVDETIGVYNAASLFPDSSPVSSEAKAQPGRVKLREEVGEMARDRVKVIEENGAAD